MTAAAGNDRAWYITSRWQEWDGEAKANVLRVLAVGVFYVVQWIHYLGLAEPDAIERQFHVRSTLLAGAWLMLALAILICLQRRVFPAALKFVSTAGDLALLTTLAALGNGPDSPLVVAYFLIIAAAALRFSVLLLWFASGGAMLGYLLLVARIDDSWFDSEHAVPIVRQLVMHVSLAFTGIILGQVVRRVRLLAEDYSRRIGAAEQVPVSQEDRQ